MKGKHIITIFFFVLANLVQSQSVLTLQDIKDEILLEQVEMSINNKYNSIVKEHLRKRVIEYTHIQSAVLDSIIISKETSVIIQRYDCYKNMSSTVHIFSSSGDRSYLVEYKAGNNCEMNISRKSSSNFHGITFNSFSNKAKKTIHKIDPYIDEISKEHLYMITFVTFDFSVPKSAPEVRISFIGMNQLIEIIQSQ